MAARLLRRVHLAALVAALLLMPGVAHAVPAGKVVFSAEPATSTDVDGGYGYVAWTLRRSGQPWEIHWRRADGSLAEYAFRPGTRVERLQIVRIVPPRSSQRITRVLSRGCDRRGCRVYAIDPETRAVSTPRWAAKIFGSPADGPLYVTGIRSHYPGSWDVPRCPSLQVRRIDGSASWTLPAPPPEPVAHPRDQMDCRGVSSWSFRDLRLAAVYQTSDLGTWQEAPWMISLVRGVPANWTQLPYSAWDSGNDRRLTLGIGWLAGALVSATAGEMRSTETDAYLSPSAAFDSPSVNPYFASQWVPRLSRRQLVATSMVSDGTDLFLAVNGDRGVNGEYGEEIPRGLGIRENRVIIERVPPPQWRATPRS